MSGIRPLSSSSAFEQQQTPRFVTSDVLKSFESVTQAPAPIPPAAAGSTSYNNLTEEEKQKLEGDLEEANESLKPYNKVLKFEYNQEAEIMQVSVIDRSTQEVVASLPPDFLVDLSEKLDEMIGMFIDEKV